MAQTFDSLGYAKHLMKAGIDQPHAEAHAEAARDYIIADLVTKDDLKTALLSQTVAFGAMLVVAVGAIVTLTRLWA